MKRSFFLGALFLSAALQGYNPDWEQNKKGVLVYQNEQYILGWCTHEKAEKMMDLIFDTHPQVCVEIGVFGGSSIYPTASALKYLGSGVVYAIDPWSREECLKGYAPTDPNYIWWNQVDQEKIYQGFEAMLQRFELTPYSKTLRMTSREALAQFEDESIDILHIDGNHTEQIALADAKMFLPKVKKGGYIWFDDANWKSTNKATMYLNEHCVLDENRSTNACFLYKKN